MHIYLYRHGACEGLSDGVSDMERRLTDEGRDTVKATLPGLRALIPQVEYILTSPMTRARETADIIAQEYRCGEFMEILPELADRGNEEKITETLNKLIGKEHVLLVGHAPHLGELAAYICKGKNTPAPDLKKSGLAGLHVLGFPEQEAGELLWVKTPDDLKNSS